MDLSGEMVSKGLCVFRFVVSSGFLFVSLGIVVTVGMVVWCVLFSSSSSSEAKAS